MFRDVLRIFIASTYIQHDEPYCDSYSDLMWAEKIKNFEFSENDPDSIYTCSRNVSKYFGVFRASKDMQTDQRTSYI